MKTSFITKIAWCAAVLSAVAFMSVSCEKPGAEEKDPESTETPTDEPQISKPDTIKISGEHPVPHPRIPMKIYDTECIASDAGVSVEVFDITENNFSIALRPGKDVASYKLDVYPLSVLYNFILDGCGLDKTAAEVENAILARLFNAEGSGGYAFSSTELGEDYAENVIDWGNSTYAHLTPVPDAQYIVAVGACYDDSASESAMTELTLVYVHTKSKALIGNPMVDVVVNAQYRGAEVTNVPNSDCAGVYYFATNMDQIDPYADAFGERMLRDFMRHYYVPNTPISSKDTQNLTYQIGPWDNPDPNLMITALAFGVDVNGTPGKSLVRQDFHLKEIPADTEEAMMTYSLDTDNYSATYAEIKAELGPECRAGFHLVLKMDESNYDGYIAPGRNYLEGDEALKAALRDHIADSGWGIKNNNFQYDYENNQSTGSSFTDKWVEYDLSPDTEYIIAYCGWDAYMQKSQLHFSEPFRTKPLVTDRPEDNKSDCTMSYSDVTTTSFVLNFEYDPSNTAVIHFICVKYGSTVYPFDSKIPEEGASGSEWMTFFDEMKNDSYMNKWPRSMSGSDNMPIAGIEPNTELVYAYRAEDMDGVVSEVKFASVTTKALQPGPDPQVSISPAWNEATKTWEVFFSMVKDCSKMMCMIGSDDENMYLYRLGTDEMRAYEFYNHWDNAVGVNGMESYADMSLESGSGRDYVALAIGFGKDENGDEVISKLEYVILTKDGQQKKISDYYPSYEEK